MQFPRAGRWRIVLDPYAVPSGTTTVDYRDEMVHPKYGTATVPDSLMQLPSGSTTSIPLVIHRGAAPEPGRTLALRLEATGPHGQSPSGPPSRGGVSYPPGILGVLRLDLPHQ